MASTEALEQYNYIFIYVHRPPKTLHSLIMAMAAFLTKILVKHTQRAREMRSS
jgi:hypothetical protein